MNDLEVLSTRAQDTRAETTVTREECSAAFPRGLGRYDKPYLIGSGGFAHVYCAWDEIDEDRVAIKVARTEDLEKAEELLGIEADAHRILGDIPGIVRLRRRHSKHQHPHLVFDFVEGENSAVVANDTPVPMLNAVKIVLGAARPMSTIHARGWVYGDMKPSNILCATDGSVKLIDLGASHPINRDPVGYGTPSYVAPERVAHRREDFRSDVYSTALTLYELLSAQTPFYREGMKASEVERLRLTKALPDVREFCRVPAGLARVIRKAAAIDPRERYPDATALCLELEPYTAPSWLRPVWRLFSFTTAVVRTVVQRR